MKRPKALVLHLDKSLAIDALILATAAFGVTLLIGGLFLTILDANWIMGANETNSIAQSITRILEMLPGVPFPLNDLADSSTTVLGLISWVVGLDLLLVTLGLWTRHSMARWIAILVFSLAAYSDFTRFLLFGIVGSPSATVGLGFDCLMIYFLLKEDFWRADALLPVASTPQSAL